MKKLVFAAVAAGAALAATAPAMAAQGCGPGGHRDYYGHCVGNGGPVIVAPGLVIGSYYPHQGWWDGHRYWAHRDHDGHGGWRYHR